MTIKNILACILLSFVFISCCDKKRHYCSIHERLDRPFGTLMNLEVEIIDGYSTHMRLYEGDFLMKINRIEKKIIKDSLVLPFKDRSGKFPTNAIVKSSDNESFDSTSYGQVKRYVGKKFNIIAYESGEFDGIPSDYFNYHPAEDVIGFHFQNFLVVVTDSSKID